MGRMAKTSPIPELDSPRKPEPELKQPAKPEPEIPRPPNTDGDVFEKDDQADSGPDKDNPLTNPRANVDEHQPEPPDAHIGATEDQVSETSAPSDDAFKDEPKQG